MGFTVLIRRALRVRMLGFTGYICEEIDTAKTYFFTGKVVAGIRSTQPTL